MSLNTVSARRAPCAPLRLLWTVLVLLLLLHGSAEAIGVWRTTLTPSDGKSIVSTCKGPLGDWNGRPHTVRLASEDASIKGALRNSGKNFALIGAKYLSKTNPSDRWVWMNADGSASDAFYQGYAIELGAKAIKGMYSNWGRVSASGVYELPFPTNAADRYLTYAGYVVGVTGKKGINSFTVDGWLNVPEEIITAEKGLTVNDVTGLPPDLKIDQHVTYEMVACAVYVDIGGTTAPPTKPPVTQPPTRPPTTPPPTQPPTEPSTHSPTEAPPTSAPTDAPSSSSGPTSGAHHRHGSFRGGVLAGVMVASAVVAAVFSILVICCLEKRGFEFEEFM